MICKVDFLRVSGEICDFIKHGEINAEVRYIEFLSERKKKKLDKHLKKVCLLIQEASHLALENIREEFEKNLMQE